VPNEVAILGVNNDYLRCAFGNPPLSSVATDRQLAGYRAAELLDQMMVTGRATGNEDVRIDPIRVVVRHSTDVLAIEDRATCAAIHYIRQFACQGITAEDVAKHVGVSRHVLERKFRHLLGRSAHAEIRQIQVARIKQLLVETDLPLKNIADLVGIMHTEYVNVMFSRHVGMTPGMYRREHQPRQSESRLASSPEPDLKEEF
jgi:LacI family transcriptional regulator